MSIKGLFRYGVRGYSLPQYNFCVSGLSRFSFRVFGFSRYGFRGSLFSSAIAYHDQLVRRILGVVSFALNKKVRFDNTTNFDINNICCIFNETIAKAIRRSSEDYFFKKSKLQST